MRARTAEDIGLIVRDRRQALGLSQAELAQRVGVSRQWVVELEGGKQRAEVGLVLRALAAMDLHVSVSPEAADAAGSPIPDPDLDAIIEAARRPLP